MKHQARELGPRKHKILTSLFKELNELSKKGMNPSEVAKFLGINLKDIQNNYTTKKLSGVIGRIREFNKAN